MMIIFFLDRIWVFFAEIRKKYQIKQELGPMRNKWNPTGKRSETPTYLVLVLKSMFKAMRDKKPRNPPTKDEDPFWNQDLTLSEFVDNRYLLKHPKPSALYHNLNEDLPLTIKEDSWNDSLP